MEPGYWLLDASAHYRFGLHEQCEVALWGRNLGATRYCIKRGLAEGVGSGDTINCQPNERIRFFGLTLFMRIG